MIFRMILVFAAVLLLSGIAAAQTVTYSFSAVVKDEGELFPGIEIGDTATGTITYDLSAPQTIDRPTRAGYVCNVAPCGVELQINGFSVSTDDYIRVWVNDDPANESWGLTFESQGLTDIPFGGDGLYEVEVCTDLLRGWNPGAFSGRMLPTQIPDVTEFELAQIVITEQSSAMNITLDILALEAVSQPAQTPAGTDVVVEPVDAITGQSPVSFDFQEVTVAGGTTVTTSEEGEPPTGFKLGSPATIYELETTAEFNGSVELCFDYSGVSYGDESGLKLFHFENGSWIDVTTSLDTENDIICGLVTSFSPFAIVEPDNAPPTAVAGPNQSIRAGDTVIVDGSASFDDNTAQAMLDYDWSFFSKPGTSTTTLDDSTSVMPSFVADVAGIYILQLIVTDEEVAASDPSYVEISSDNLAPTAVAEVDFSLAIIGSAVNFDGTGSSDPEMDAITYSWNITAAPAGSTASLMGDETDSPTLTTDLEGTYEVSLTVSDFLGPGAPTLVEVTADTASGFAEIVIMDASDQVAALTDEQVTKKGNRKKLGKILAKAIKELQKDKIDKTIKELIKAIERTDGCFLRGEPDGNGSGRDWITDCDAQLAIYDLLILAADSLED